MKRIVFLVTFACVAMFAACEYDDSALVDRMDGFESRLQRLEELCAQMNTNISSLQTIVNALQQKDFITTVAPINNDGKEVGYSITFSSGKSITIYHGNDGKDGADGTDGKTPQIGVKQDADGVYYWTVDGEWLTDAAGKKIQATAEDGADGENGTTPQLKIEEDYWYVSYDEGKTWTKLGKATGEDGTDGSDGTSGDNIFQSVTQDANNVYFKLADGTTITIPKSASMENIVLTYIPRYSDGKATVFYTEKSDSYVEFDFEVSPASAAANWRNIATVKAVYTETRAGVEFVDMAILDWSTDTAKGTISVRASGKNLSDAFFAGTQDASARLVVRGDNINIISEYIALSKAKSDIHNLSQSETANCYIASKDGKFSFNATVKGCGTTSIGKPSSAVVVWETFNTLIKPTVGDVVTDVSLKDGIISFKTTNNEGNALIAAIDENNKILWSWHIWVTDYKPEIDFDVYPGYEELKVMDRNLGAMSSRGKIESIGMVYQWGRKDPFFGAIENKTMASTVDIKVVITSKEIGTDQYATSNPTTYILALRQGRDWRYAPNNLAWSTTKTEFDPCPPGWKVPDGGESGLYKEIKLGDFDYDNRGMFFKGANNSPDIWMPAQGYYSDSETYYSGWWQVGNEGRYWTTKTSDIYSGYFGFKPNALSDNIAGDDPIHCSRANGHPVRCVKDE